MNQTNQTKKPEAKFRVGSVSAAIWNRTKQTKTGETYEQRKATLERSYRTAESTWKQTNSYDTNDIPKAVLALTKAYEYMATTRGNNDGNADNDDSDGGQAPTQEEQIGSRGGEPGAPPSGACPPTHGPQPTLREPSSPGHA